MMTARANTRRGIKSVKRRGDYFFSVCWWKYERAAPCVHHPAVLVPYRGARGGQIAAGAHTDVPGGVWIQRAPLAACGRG